MLANVLRTIAHRKEAAVAAVSELLRIPSVSTKPDHAPEMRRCAMWLADQLQAGGFRADLRETGGGKGHPLVLAKNDHKPGRPTVLFYGHYDVQPPEPLELWKSPPFQPEVRKDDAGFEAVFARGAV